MKKIITLFTLTLFVGQSFSQTNNCEELKKQNSKLLEKLLQYGIDLNDSLVKVKSYSTDIKVNLLKCVGDKKAQTVTVSFNIINPKLTNQNFSIKSCMFSSNMSKLKTQAFDDIGNPFEVLIATLATQKSNNFAGCGMMGENKITNILNTGNYPIIGTLTFANILPNVVSLKQIDICMNNYNLVGEVINTEINTAMTEFKNVKIVWK